MTRFLVTGASGFIGGHLMQRLNALDTEARGLVRPSSNTTFLDSFDADLIRGDVCDLPSLQRAVKDVDVVIHLAGVTSAFSESDFTRVNGLGTANVAEACAASAKTPVLIVVSSVAAAGPVERGRLRRESQSPNPISIYGRSKRESELAAERFADRVPITIVRPGIVFGQRDRDTLPVFRTIHRLRMHFVVGRQTPPLSLIHVTDFVDVLLRAAEIGKRIPPDERQRSNGEGYYFACSDEHPDYGEWGHMIRATLDRPRAPVIPLVGPIPWLAAATNELIARVRCKPDIFNIDKIREAMASSWACSPEAANRDLNFAPPYSLQDRTHETSNWYRRHGWL